MEKFFKLKENHTSIKTEVNAGLTTFVSMAYIIFLNPVFLSATGMDATSVMIATCISAAIGSILCALLANKPFALAPGMGMNAYFAYTLCAGCGYTWQQALAITFISGILFVLVTVSPLRDKIITSIPMNLKHAITAGIGLFIAIIGFLDSGIVTMTEGYPALGDLSSPTVIIAIIGLFITMVLVAMKVKGNLIIGMIITMIIGLIAGQIELPTAIIGNPSSLGQVFMKMDFAGLITTDGLVTIIAVVISMTIVDMFDTLGFLIGTTTRAGMLDKNGNFPEMKRVLLADSLATVIGACFGTSTVTCYAESSTGIAAGGRTGLTSLTTSVCFIIIMIFAPIACMAQTFVIAPALIIVGMYLVSDIKNIDFKEPDDSIPAFLTVAAMPFAYSITTGIAAGVISFTVCKLFTRKFKELNVEMIVLTIIFILYFVFNH